MSTYTDFYLGRGDRAEWLGSLRGDAHPERDVLTVPPGRLALTATNETTYRAAVADLLVVWAEEDLGEAYPQEGGWPWVWNHSHLSSWIIAFDPHPGQVFLTVGGGVAWHPVDRTDPRVPEGDDPLGPADLDAWLRAPAAPPSVPLPLMRDPVTGSATSAAGGAQ